MALSYIFIESNHLLNIIPNEGFRMQNDFFPVKHGNNMGLIWYTESVQICIYCNQAYWVIWRVCIFKGKDNSYADYN